MRRRMSTAGRGLWLAVLAISTLVTSADASSSGLLCRRGCRDTIAACVAAGSRRTVCRRQVLGRCHQEGLTVCETLVGASSATSWGSLVAPSDLAHRGGAALGADRSHGLAYEVQSVR